MKSLIVGIAVAGLGGLVLGYFSGAPTVKNDAAPVAGTHPEPVRDIHPEWRPGFGQALEDAAEAEEFIALLNEVAESAADGERDIWMKAVIAGWVEVSGAEAAKTLKNADKGFDTKTRSWVGSNLDYVFLRLAFIDLDAALEIGNGYGGKQMAPLLLERRPELLPELIQKNRFHGTQIDWHRAGEQLARGGWQNADLLKTWIAKQQGERSTVSAHLFAGFARELATTEPGRLMAWAAELQALAAEKRSNPYISQIHSIVRAEVVRAVAETDIEGAKALAEKSDDHAVRHRVAGLIARDDIYAAADWWVQQNSVGLNSLTLRELAPAMAELPVGEALRFLEKYSAPRAQGLPSHDTGPYFEQLGGVATGDLAAEVAALPDSPARDAMLASALRVWSEAEPEAALARGLELLRAGEDSGLAYGLTRALASHPDAFLDYAAALPPDEQQKFAKFTVIRALRSGPGSLSELIAEGVDNGSPAAGAAVAALVGEWAQDGLMATSRWLDALPEGAAKDAGIVELVRRIAPHDAAAALEWAQAAQGAEARADALKAAETRQLDL